MQKGYDDLKVIKNTAYDKIWFLRSEYIIFRKIKERLGNASTGKTQKFNERSVLVKKLRSLSNDTECITLLLADSKIQNPTYVLPKKN